MTVGTAADQGLFKLSAAVPRQSFETPARILSMKPGGERIPCHHF